MASLTTNTCTPTLNADGSYHIQLGAWGFDIALDSLVAYRRHISIQDIFMLLTIQGCIQAGIDTDTLTGDQLAAVVSQIAYPEPQ